MLRRRTQVTIDCTQLAIKQLDSGNDRARQRETDPRKPAGSTQSLMRQQDRPEQADRREAQIDRASRFERGHRAAAQLQESRDTLFDGTPEQKAQSHRNADHQPHSGSKSKTSLTDTW